MKMSGDKIVIEGIDLSDCSMVDKTHTITFDHPFAGKVVLRFVHEDKRICVKVEVHGHEFL